MININVAVAVIHYGNQYLLGFRHAKQHQGNRYEFVGGKIEDNETAEQALIREVEEEVGLQLGELSLINQLGVLRHYYEDSANPNHSKNVCLHVFRVELCKSHYQQLSKQKQGREGQPLQWVAYEALVEGKYKLPEANKSILQWLRLPSLISITTETEWGEDLTIDYSMQSDAIKKWVGYYQKKLATQAAVYARFKQCDLPQQVQLIQNLLSVRADLKLIVDYRLANYLKDSNVLASQIVAQHIPESSLKELNKEDITNQLSTSLPITISSHGQARVLEVNELAQYRLQKGLSPVVANFISPVKATKTHPDAVPLGWQKFMSLAQLSEVPVIALGGMSPNELRQVRQHQGDKVAGIRQFLT